MQKYVLVSILTLFVLTASMHAVYAVTGKIEIVGTNVPTKLIADRSFQMNVSLKITCTSTTDNILARVDISPHGSHQILASNSMGLGSIPDPWGKKAWNITITNNLRSPVTMGPWGLDVKAWVFAGVYTLDVDNLTITVQVVTRSAPIQVVTASLTNTTGSSLVLTSSTSITQTSSSSLLVIPQATITVGGPLAIAIVAASVAIVLKKKRVSLVHESRSERILTVLTGYPEIDRSMGGGVPVGHSIIIVSPPYDEKDLLIEKIISSSIKSGFSVFFVSRQMLKTRTLTSKFNENFYAFTPRADKIPRGGNIIKIMDVQNPNDFNISLSKAMEPLMDGGKKKLIILDQLVSDILLEHKALATRRWLDEFLVRRKSEGFTVIVTLNPLMVADQQRQALIDLFDGVVEVYEKELPEQSKRYMIVRKMYARKYSDTAVELDRHKLS